MQAALKRVFLCAMRFLENLLFNSMATVSRISSTSFFDNTSSSSSEDTFEKICQDSTDESAPNKPLNTRKSNRIRR